MPFDEIDFEARPWVANSGWPFNSATLAPYYARALKLCEAGECQFRAEEVFPPSQPEMIAGFEGPAVVSNVLERWSPPTRFGRRYFHELKTSENVNVLLKANCLHLQLAPAADRIENIEVASFAKTRFLIRATTFVLACGTLETTRLLLASNDLQERGIGNHSGKLGRFYMSHLNGTIAVATLRDNRRNFLYECEKDKDGVYCRRRFWITAAAQEQHRMLNFVGFFFRPPLGSVEHRDALLSAIYLTKELHSTLGRNALSQVGAIIRERHHRWRHHLKAVFGNLSGLISPTLRILRGRYFGERRVPLILPPKERNNYYLFYQSEQAPNAESCVTLGEERDEFGMPRLRVNIAFSEIDLHTVMSGHRLLREQFAASGTGKLLYDESTLRQSVEEQMRHFDSAGHQLGTTRMSTDPDDGVVNPDCRIHGIENLYVAAGSVFPTGGHANPTLTIVALAVRLADHIKESSRVDEHRIGMRPF